MGIDIYRKKETKGALFSISDELYDILENVFDKFRDKTGVFIDNYGDCRLTFQHSNVLLQLIKTEIESKRLRLDASLREFIEFLQEIVKNETEVDLIGD
jgi:hypothetical protein